MAIEIVSGAGLFTPEEAALLALPGVTRAWFAEMDLPSGFARLHNGVGTVTVAGSEWRGVSDPIGGRAVSLSGVRDVEFGQAAAATIILTGADREFLRSVHATRREIEGRTANLYWGAFDPETQTLIGTLKGLFTRGYMSAPSIAWEGIGSRTITITIENIWSSKNFKIGNRWSPVGHRLLYPGDKGLDYIGQIISENWS